jgi:TRAP-type C4-dicarboxylate transport system substrate-binding protein
MSTPIQIRMGGYGPPSTGFSKALKFIGDKLTAEFGDGVDVKYVWNIMELGYKAEDIVWLVEHGLLTLGYQSSSYLTDRVPELGFVDLPFLFSTNAQARAAMDGELGALLIAKTEERANLRVLGWLENGFRHISNRLRPVHGPADMKGMRIRVLPSEVQKRTFELLGAVALRLDLSEAIAMIKSGSLDAQENPLANTVTYGVHNFHKFHTLTSHFYISRPVFVHRAAYDAWPEELRRAMREAVRDAVGFQRKLALAEQEQARRIIAEAGCTFVTPTPAEHARFVDAMQPLLAEARETYGEAMFGMVPKP